MAYVQEYHFSVRHTIPASVFLLSLIAIVAFIAPAQAQINGAPTSVTSQGFGGHAVNGTRSSVTSLGPRGYSQGSRTTLGTVPGNHRTDPNRHRRHTGQYASPLFYAVPVPYAVDEGIAQDAEEENDSNEQGGPTVFDRRGSGARSYVAPMNNAPAAHAAQAADEGSPDAADTTDPTLLVFKDGHQMEVGNYAIVGSTLFDLTPGHPRRIALADLDLTATHQQNDSRGVVFQLPPSLQAN